MKLEEEIGTYVADVRIKFICHKKVNNSERLQEIAERMAKSVCFPSETGRTLVQDMVIVSNSLQPADSTTCNVVYTTLRGVPIRNSSIIRALEDENED